MGPKLDAAAGTQTPPPPAGVPAAVLREALQRSTDASTTLAEVMNTTLSQLPQMLATALANTPRAQQAAGDAAAAVGVPRDSRDRRVPDFWEKNPVAWFRILDHHFTKVNNASETDRFDVLLPLLHGDAITKVQRLVATPTQTVYTDAKAILIKHFKRPAEEMAAELHGLSSFGDRSAVDHLEHMRSLQPGDPETALFRHIFVHCVPSHVRAATSCHLPDLDKMAAAADVALAACGSLAPPSVSPSAPEMHVSAIGQAPADRSQLTNGLCFIHARWGRNAYNCAAPDTCKMKAVLKRRSNRQQRPPPPASASGNAPAGGQ